MIRMPALHRLDQNRRDPVGVLTQNRQRLLGAVVQHHHVVDAMPGRTRHARARTQLIAGHMGTAEHFVEGAVVVAGEIHHGMPPGDGTGTAQCGHDRFRAGGGEGGTLVSGQAAQAFGHARGRGYLRAQFDTAVELGMYGLSNRRMPVAEKRDAQAHGDVDIVVAVDIGESGAVAGLHGDLVGQSLPVAMKADHVPRIGHVARPAFCQCTR